jgi:two-component system response regulator RegX3
MYQLLLLEDDISLVEGLQYALKKNGFELDVVRTVQEANAILADTRKYDLLLLDVTLPDGSGFEVCEKVRQANNTIPIIYLTAADEETAIIRGLDSGGDDYITKPFRLGELCSRIRALLRRSGIQKSNSPQRLISGPLSVDLMASKAYLAGQSLELTGAEYRLLCLLLQNSGRVLTRNSILDLLWDGHGNFVDDNTLSVYVRRLREKIEKDPSHPEHLVTVRGFGYQWKE